MKKKVFWIGVAVLIVGISLLSYGYTTIQNMYASWEHLSLYRSEVRLRWDLAQILQPIGLGMLVLGAIIIAYSLFVKE